MKTLLALNETPLRRLALLCVLLLAGLATWAEPAASGDCRELETQTAITACLESAAADSAEIVADTFEAIAAAAAELGAPGSATLAALRSDQFAWVETRDQACDEAASDYAGGSLEPAVKAQCLARANLLRTRALLSALD